MRKFKTAAAIMAATAMIVTSYGQAPVQARAKTAAVRKTTKKKKASVKLSGIPKAAETKKNYTLKASAKNVKKAKYKFTYKFKGKTKTIRSWSKKKTVKFKASKNGTYKFTVNVKGSKGAKASAMLTRKFATAKKKAAPVKTNTASSTNTASAKTPSKTQAAVQNQENSAETQEQAKSAFTLSPATLSMKEKQNASITASGWQSSDGKLSWQSSDSSVASVHSTGKSSASVVSMKAGTAVITATSADGTKATCTVTVKASEGTNVTPSAPSDTNTSKPAQEPTKPTAPADTPSKQNQETPKPSQGDNTSGNPEKQDESGQTTPADTPSTPSDTKKAAIDYSYTLKEIHPTGQDLEHYSNPCSCDVIMVFAKTDYQNRDVYLVDENGNIKENGNGVNGGLYKDIAYTGESKSSTSLSCNSVEGGLLFTFLEKKAGTHTYHLQDFEGRKLNSNTITVTVKDKEAEESRQIDNLIVTALNSYATEETKHDTAQKWIDDSSTYTVGDKLSLIANWMRTTSKANGGFDYEYSGDWPVAEYELDGEWWQARKLDCTSACEVLEKVAMRMGVSKDSINEIHEGTHVYFKVGNYTIDGTPDNYAGYLTNNPSYKDISGYQYYDMLNLEEL